MAASKPWSSEDIRENARKELSLEGDAKLLEFMKTISDKIINHGKLTNTNIDTMVSEVNRASISLDNVANRLSSLSHYKFVENRVYEDDDTIANIKEVPVGIKSKEYNPVKTLATIFENSITMLNNCYEKVSVSLDDSDDEDEQIKSVIYRAKNEYENRPVPHLIGSKEWKEKWHIGLCDSDESLSENEEFSDASESVSLPSNGPTLSESGSSVWSINPNTRFNKTKVNESSMSSDDEEISSTSKTSSNDARYKNNNKVLPSMAPIPDSRYFIHQPKEKGLFDNSSNSEDDGTNNMNKNHKNKPQPSQRSQHTQQQNAYKTKNIANIFNDQPPDIDVVDRNLNKHQSNSLFDNYEDDDDELFNNQQRKPIQQENIKEKKPVNLFDDDDFNSFMNNLDNKTEEKSLPPTIAKKEKLFTDESDDEHISKISIKSEKIEKISDKIIPHSTTGEINAHTNLFEDEDDLFSTTTKPNKIFIEKLPTFNTPTILKTKISNLFDDSPPDDDFESLFKTSKKNLNKNSTVDKNSNKKNSFIENENIFEKKITTNNNLLDKEPVKQITSNLFDDTSDNDDVNFFENIKVKIPEQNKNENNLENANLPSKEYQLFDEPPDDVISNLTSKENKLFDEPTDDHLITNNSKQPNKPFLQNNLKNLFSDETTEDFDDMFSSSNLISSKTKNQYTTETENVIEKSSHPEIVLENDNAPIVHNSINPSKLEEVEELSKNVIVNPTIPNVNFLDDDNKEFNDNSLLTINEKISSNTEKEDHKNSDIITSKKSTLSDLFSDEQSFEISNKSTENLNEIIENTTPQPQPFKVSEEINNETNVHSISYLPGIFNDLPPDDNDNDSSPTKSNSNEPDIFDTPTQNLITNPTKLSSPSSYNSALFQDTLPPDDFDDFIVKNENLSTNLSNKNIFYDDFSEIISNQSVIKNTNFLFDDEPPPDNFDEIFDKKNDIKENYEIKNSVEEKFKSEIKNNDDKQLKLNFIESTISVSELIKKASIVNENDTKEIISKPEIKKLNSKLNINVAALIPGAKMPIVGKPKVDQIDGSISSKVVENANENNVQKSSNEIEVKNETKKELSNNQTDTNLLNSLNKNRPKILTKRRPSTRSGRLQNYEKSLTIENENDESDGKIEIFVEKSPNKSGDFIASLNSKLMEHIEKNEASLKQIENNDEIFDDFSNLKSSQHVNPVDNLKSKLNEPLSRNDDKYEDDWLVKATLNDIRHESESVQTEEMKKEIHKKNHTIVFNENDDYDDDDNDDDDNDDLFASKFSISTNQKYLNKTETKKISDNLPIKNEKEIFQKIKIYKKQPVKKEIPTVKVINETIKKNDNLSAKTIGLFDSDDDDDNDDSLFGGSSKKNYGAIPKKVALNLPKKDNLFDDIDDDDDDLFGTKNSNPIKKAQLPTKSELIRGLVHKKIIEKKPKSIQRQTENTGYNPLADLLDE